MASDRRFVPVLLGWVAATVVPLLLLAVTWPREGLMATRLLLLVAAGGALAALVAHVDRTNRAVARFVEALRHGDVGVRFDADGGGGFAALGEAMNAAMRDLGAARAADRDELRYWEALVDDLPIAILTVSGTEGVRAANKAARRLFGAHQGTRIDDFRGFGTAFADALAAEAPVGQAMLPLRIGGGEQRALVRTGTLARLGRPVRIVAVEPVGGALDAVEIGTQTDLVRVLTHEILNSLTPVTTLAGVAAVLLGEEEPDIAEARTAVLTLARRVEGLRRFIDSYRSVARLPEPRRRRFAAPPFAAELGRLFAAEWVEHRLELAVDPALVLDADPDLIAQLLINLLRNAAQATENMAEPHVRLSMTTSPGGIAIAVEDNGPGIPAAARGDVFLPFYTSRPTGTGIGLNLSRQIAVAHGWRIEVGDGDLGGARIRLFAPDQGLVDAS